MASIATAAGHDQNVEIRALLALVVRSLEETLADPDHTLTLAHRDRLELIHGNTLRLLELTNQPSPFSREESTGVKPPQEVRFRQAEAGEIQSRESIAVLPVDKSSAKLKNPPLDNSSRRSPSRRILVVDDKIDAAESLAMLLGLQGHQVETAHDGPAALQAVRIFSPDIVLLDIGLPGMSGYEVAQRLQHEPARKNMLLVALTGYGQPEDHLRSSEAGFDSHLVKPASTQALASIISLSRPSQ